MITVKFMIAEARRPK